MKSTIVSIILLFIYNTLTVQSQCLDSTNFTLGEYEFQGATYNKNCDWIESRSGEGKRGLNKFCGYDSVKEACPVACQSCPATNEPTESVSPSMSPTVECNDPSLTFKAFRGEYTCEFLIGRPRLCGRRGVTETCPKTCGGCRTCTDSPLRFLLCEDGQEECQVRTCFFVAMRPEERCAIPGISDACRQTCGKC